MLDSAPLTLDDIRHLAVVDVPTAGEVLGLSHHQAYRAVRAGTIPSIRLGAKRVVVPVPQLLRLLEGQAPTTGDAA